MPRSQTRSRGVAAPRRRNQRGDTVSYLLTVAFVTMLFLVGLAVVLILFGWGTAAGTVLLTMVLVLLVLAGLFLATGGGASRRDWS